MRVDDRAQNIDGTSVLVGRIFERSQRHCHLLERFVLMPFERLVRGLRAVGGAKQQTVRALVRLLPLLAALLAHFRNDLMRAATRSASAGYLRATTAPSANAMMCVIMVMMVKGALRLENPCEQEIDEDTHPPIKNQRHSFVLFSLCVTIWRSRYRDTVSTSRVVIVIVRETSQ